MKSYRFYGEEMEVLGSRLDSARAALSAARTPWARNYWQQNVERLLFQWRQLPILHDGDAQVTLLPRWNIHYNFAERNQEIAHYGIFDRLFDSVYQRQPDLTASWERNRERRLARAQ